MYLLFYSHVEVFIAIRSSRLSRNMSLKLSENSARSVSKLQESFKHILHSLRAYIYIYAVLHW